MGSRRLGFTLVEMMVVIPTVLLMVGAFIAMIVQLTGDAVVANKRGKMLYDIRYALSAVDTDVRTSAGYLAANSISVSSPQGFGDTATPFENIGQSSQPVLILRMFTTTKQPEQSDTQIIPLANTPNACSHASVLNNVPLMMNVVYFVKDNKLWRRVVMPTNYTSAGCSMPWQLPSCSPGYSSSFCKTQDQVLISDVDELTWSVRYFSNPSTSSEDTTASDPGVVTTVRSGVLSADLSVEVDIETKAVVAGRHVSESLSLRSTRSSINASSEVFDI